MGGLAVVSLGRRYQLPRKDIAVGLAVKVFECAESDASVRRDVDNADILAGHRPPTSTIFRHLVCK